MLEQRAEMGAESAGLRTVKSVDLSGLKALAIDGFRVVPATQIAGARDAGAHVTRSSRMSLQYLEIRLLSKRPYF